MLLISEPMWRGVFIIFGTLYWWFVIFNFFLDKCGVLNEIFKQVIFIWKIYTNKISIHIDIEFHNAILILWVVYTYLRNIS